MSSISARPMLGRMLAAAWMAPATIGVAPAAAALY
jgi:hypothetical protein